MDAADIQRIVNEADDAVLLRAVDGLAASRDWELLETLGDRCRQAVEYGRQLWGVAMHVDYRLAWEAPAAFAARAVERGSSRFTLGPLTEVAASTHDWASLDPHVGDPVLRATLAQERALRGEDLVGVPELADLNGLPPCLQEWEPAYALPAYRDRSAKFPQPEIAVRHVPLDRDIASATAGADLDAIPGGNPGSVEGFEDEASDALREVTRAWWTQSAGQAEAVVVEGGAAQAVAALLAGQADQGEQGGRSERRDRAERGGDSGGGDSGGGGGGGSGGGGNTRIGLLRIEPADALAILQWCGASGGAYGPRPGGASGRFAAWWAAAALAGLDWPDGRLRPDWSAELGEAITTLRWYRWASETPDTGWTLRLAVEDPAEGLAWAVDATDHREDADEPEELQELQDETG